MTADAYLPVTIRNVPAAMVLKGRSLREPMAHYARKGIVRVIAGPEACHVVIDIKRPYTRARASAPIPPFVP